MSNINFRDKLKREFLELLKVDEEFRFSILGYLGFHEVLNEIRKIWIEIKDLKEESNKIWKEIKELKEENSKIWKEIKDLKENTNKIWKEIEKIWIEIKDLKEELKKVWKKIEEHSKILEEHSKRIEELSKRIEEHGKILEKHSKRIEEHSKVLEEHGKRIEELTIAIKNLQEQVINLQRKIDALGARWGLIAESSFKEGMKGILEKILGVAKVEKWIYYDSNGEVYGYPSPIDIDLVIKDKEHILVEIKSSTSRSDIGVLYKIGKFYEKIVGIKPKLVLITCYIDDNSKVLAKSLGIEVYTV